MDNCWGTLTDRSNRIIWICGLADQKKKTSSKKFIGFDWLLVFLSLFWLREPFNLARHGVNKIVFGGPSYFGGDELRISRGLNLWDGTIPIIMGVLGLAICSIVIFRIMPRAYRRNFMVGGLMGGALGYLIWMKLLGPIILP